MDKLLNFDFYRVVMPNEEQRAFEAVLQEVNVLEGAARSFDNGDYHVAGSGV